MSVTVGLIVLFIVVQDWGHKSIVGMVYGPFADPLCLKRREKFPMILILVVIIDF